jgi:hypothetical protein
VPQTGWHVLDPSRILENRCTVLQNDIERHKLAVRNVVHLDPYQSFQKGLQEHIVTDKNKALLAVTGDLFDVLVEPLEECIDLLVLRLRGLHIGKVPIYVVAIRFQNGNLKSRRERRGLLRMPPKFGDMRDNVERGRTEKEVGGLLCSQEDGGADHKGLLDRVQKGGLQEFGTPPSLLGEFWIGVAIGDGRRIRSG